MAVFIDACLVRSYNGYIMKRLFITLSFISLFALLTGCGGGGSSNPASAVVAPQIVAVTPNSGGPGTIVQIQGRSFGSVQAGSLISYSGVNVVPNSWSDTLIVATIPNNATSDGSFVITVNNNVSNPSTVFTISSPAVSFISPTTGNPGSQVIISGSNFGTQTAESSVKFNGQTATIISWGTTQITCTVPITLTTPGAVSVVVYANISRPSNTFSFTISVPTITSISPTTDNVGATVTINGSGFGATQTTSTVTVNGNQATIVFWSDTFVQVRIPTGVAAGSNNVIVTVNGRASTPSTVTVVAPVITTQSATASKNAPLTLNGQHFGTNQTEGNGTISVQGAGTVAPTTWSDTAISFNWPIDNVIGTQQVPVTITVGGLSTTVTVTAE